MSALGFYIKEADIAWIRKLATQLKQTNINHVHMDLVVWRCVRELTNRDERNEKRVTALEKKLKNLSDK